MIKLVYHKWSKSLRSETNINNQGKKIIFLKLIIFLTCFFMRNATQGQANYPKVTLNTPEVSAFNRNIEMPVSLYTGLPNIEIPIFNINIKGVSVPIKLSYHAGGIRVDQEATWVGLGWNLSYGGEISRKIRGIPDEFLYMNTAPNTVQTVGYFMSLPNISAGPNSDNQEARFGRIKDAKYNNNDYMPDEFYYSILGFSGRFMFSQPLNKFVLFPKEDITIDKKVGVSNRDVDVWNLKLQDGVSVDFGKDGYTASDTRAFGPTSAKNSWLVKTIRNNFNDSISYNYEKFNYFTTKLAGQYTKFDTHSGYSGNTDFSTSGVSDCRLKSIYFPGGYIEFYSVERDDMPTRALDKIKVFDNLGNVIKEIEFVYSYFIGRDYDILSIVNPILDQQISANYRYKRLKLDSLRIKAGQGEAIQYSFDYNYLDKMPSKYSFSQDHYGFFNGIDNSRLYGFIPTLDNFYQGGDRRVKPESSKVFSLKSITYPEKGKVEFSYEGNNSGIMNIPNNLLANYQDDNFLEKYAAISVSSYSHNTSYPQPDEVVNQTRYFRKRFSIAGAGYPNFSKNFSVSTNFGLSATSANLPNFANNVEFLLEKINADNTRSVIRRFNTTDMNYSGSGTPPRNGQDNYMIPLQTGEYEMTVKILFLAQVNSPADNQPYNLSFFVSWRELDPGKSSVNVGGLRIKEIKHYDHNNILSKQKTYSYVNPYAFPSNPLYSSGQIVSFPLYYQPKIRKIQGGQQGRTEYASIMYYSSNSILPLETTAGSYSGYEYVNEAEVDFNNTTLSTRTDSHFSFDRPYFSQFHSNKMKGLIEPMEWNRGKLLDRQYYRKGQLIKKEEFEYHNLSPHLTTANGEDFVDEINTDLISFQSFNFSCQCLEDWPEDFFDTDGFIDNCVYYYYSPFDNFTISVSGQLGMGGGISTSSCLSTTKVPYFTHITGFDKIKSKTITVLDDPQNPIIQKEEFLYGKTPIHHQVTAQINKSSNILDVETQIKYPQDIILTGEEEIARQALINQHQIDVKLKQVRIVNGKEDVSQTDFQYDPLFNLVNARSTKTNSGINGDLEVRSEFTKFDQKGNLRETNLKGGAKLSYLYSYNWLYPIAEIKNGDYATIESILGGPSVASSISASNPNDAQVKTWIDLLRNSPLLKNAQITSYTYKPLVGMTSQTDAKGMTTTYEYDAFQRLMNVKDQNGNILKHTDYHYQN